MVNYLKLFTVVSIFFYHYNEGAPIGSTEAVLKPKATKPDDGRPCYLFISEVNTDFPGDYNKQFIELELVCPTKRKIKNPFSGYKLVIIRGNPLAIVVVVDLGSLLSSYADYKYIVLGSASMPGVQIDLTSRSVQSVYINNYTKHALPTGDESPYGILLVHHKSPLITRDIKLYQKENGEYREFNLASENLIQKYIIENAKDLFVYGRKVPTGGCLFFDLVWPKGSYANIYNRYLLRDWDSEGIHGFDYTLNRCTRDLVGFKPESFKYGLGTPGQANNCEGRGFFTEDIIDSVSPYRPLAIESNLNLGECEPPSKRFKKERFRDVSKDKFQMFVEKAAVANPSCNINMDSHYSFSSSAEEVITLNSLIRRSGEVSLSPFVLRSSFNSSWKEQCKTYLPKKGNILDNPDIQFWIDISVSKNECRFSCFACKFYFKHNFRLDMRHKQEMQGPNGYFSNCTYENQRKIKDHLKQEVHFEAVRFLSEVSEASTSDQYNAAIKKAADAETAILMPTIRLVKFVYAETIADVPFRKHKIFMDTLKSLGVDIGIHHHHATAAENIMSIISESFHKTLLKHLVDEQKPFSLMIDGTTDVQNMPLLICYMQTLEDGLPIVYFYALVYLESGESAVSMFNSFENQLKKDEAIQAGFIDFFKRNLINLSSDGASVNVGSERSFHTLTKAYVGRHVPLVQCFAHKLQLTINRAIRKQKDDKFSNYFKQFEKSTTEFFKFYLSRGSKRWSHLVEVGNLLGIKPRRMKRFLEVRWASSEYEIMKSLVYDYDILKHDLLDINYDTDFAAPARSTAMSLYTLIEDKTYSLVLREMLDLLFVYKGMSLTLQESTGILADKSDVVEKGIMEFRELQQNPGAYVTDFLSNCSCPNVCGEGNCSLVDFDACKEVFYNNFVLTDVDNSSIVMSQYRHTLYEAIIKEIHYYFDLDLLQSFEIFNPKKIILPTCLSPLISMSKPDEDATSTCLPYDDNQVLEVYTIPKSKLERVCSFYGIDNNTCEIFRNDWENVINTMSQMPTVITNFANEDASSFWPTALTLKELPWTNVTRSIVEFVLVTAMSSSDCERGFSYVTRLKSNERSNLSTKVLQNIVRIKVNGPQNIDHFNAEKYAKEFLRVHVRVDDLTLMGGRPPTNHVKSSFKRSRLF